MATSKKNNKVDSLTLFLPGYNEEAVIKETVNNGLEHLKKAAKDYEVLVINDGSKDGTEKVVKQLAKKNKHVRLFSQPNKGYGGAIKAGFKHSKHEYVSFIDSDGQFNFKEITKFTPHLKNYDFVIGYRINRRDPFHRKLNAFIWKLWMWLLFGLWVKDIDCAFKVIKKEALDSIKLDSESALTSAELLIKARQKGYKFKQIGVNHYPRTAGEQTGANLSVVIRAFKESFMLWYLLNFKS